VSTPCQGRLARPPRSRSRLVGVALAGIATLAAAAAGCGSEGPAGSSTTTTTEPAIVLSQCGGSQPATAAPVITPTAAAAVAQSWWTHDQVLWWSNAGPALRDPAQLPNYETGPALRVSAYEMELGKSTYQWRIPTGGFQSVDVYVPRGQSRYPAEFLADIHATGSPSVVTSGLSGDFVERFVRTSASAPWLVDLYAWIYQDDAPFSVPCVGQDGYAHRLSSTPAGAAVPTGSMTQLVAQADQAMWDRGPQAQFADTHALKHSEQVLDDARTNAETVQAVATASFSADTSPTDVWEGADGSPVVLGAVDATLIFIPRTASIACHSGAGACGPDLPAGEYARVSYGYQTMFFARDPVTVQQLTVTGVYTGPVTDHAVTTSGVTVGATPLPQATPAPTPT
jgi:hypothetical protein